MSASGGGFTFARSHSGDRFYNPPAMRRQQQLILQQQLQEQQQQQQQQLLQQRSSSSKGAATGKVDSSSCEAESRTDSESSSSSKPSVCSSPPPAPPRQSDSTNLDRFLESVTPLVSGQYLSKTYMKEMKSLEGDFHPYFNLGDLWESFKEWSVYGAGVPIVMNGRDSVVQYYVPYLSGIQLYVDPAKPPLRFRRPGEDSDSESPRETSSEGSSDGESERQSKHVPGSLWDMRDRLNLNRLSLEDKLIIGSVSPDTPPGLVFQYLERDPPYLRLPLADKVSSLSSRFPEVKAFNSCDLLPHSWISVAWYPIYRIPTGPTLRDLDACFLTFHSLSTQPQGGSGRPQVLPSSFRRANGTSDASLKLTLPVFGLASYKFKGSVWTPIGLHERQQANSLLQAAEDWLCLLKVDHHDYRFFANHNTYPR